MAGVKGKSGGPRKNAGGARPGAGRKPKQPDVTDERDPLTFLLDVMQGVKDANATQLRAAITAVQYVNTRKHDGTKKNELAEAAKRVSKGRFAAVPPPPKLVVNNK